MLGTSTLSQSATTTIGAFVVTPIYQDSGLKNKQDQVKPTGKSRESVPIVKVDFKSVVILNVVAFKAIIEQN